MKRDRGFTDACVAIVLTLLVVFAGLALAGCGGSSNSSSAASAPSPTTTPSAGSAGMTVARTESVVKALMATWNNAWSAKRDRGALSSLFADEVQYYDATAPGAAMQKSDLDAMGQDPDWWKSFRLKLKSFFVSPDGRFAATLGRIAIRDDAGNLPWQPGASVAAFANDKVVWEYDYYGGASGKITQTGPMLGVPRSAAAPGSSAAQAAVAEATATIKQWLAAYNGRDVTTFLSSYAEKARYVDVVSPRWRVMTKSQLATDVVAQFPRTEFQSELKPPPGSAMDSSFFVSADGRFAAVQGTYSDEATQQPMLVILELKAGQIVRQYNYIALDRRLLRP